MKSQRTASKTAKKLDKQWWLVTLDVHGNPTLCDGPHSRRSGADHAMELITALGLKRDERYAVAELTITEWRPSKQKINQEAVATLLMAGLGRKG